MIETILYYTPLVFLLVFITVAGILAIFRNRQNLSSTAVVLWLALVLFFPFIGPVLAIYFVPRMRLQCASPVTSRYSISRVRLKVKGPQGTESPQSGPSRASPVRLIVRKKT
jgi:hypothetical protein